MAKLEVTANPKPIYLSPNCQSAYPQKPPSERDKQSAVPASQGGLLQHALLFQHHFKHGENECDGSTVCAALYSSNNRATDGRSRDPKATGRVWLARAWRDFDKRVGGAKRKEKEDRGEGREREKGRRKRFFESSSTKHPRYCVVFRYVGR